MVLNQFDKIINVKLITNTGESDTILCQSEGIKPDIKISGSFVAADAMAMLKLSISNIYLKNPMSAYANDSGTKNSGYIQIFAGYAGKLDACITGTCMTASQLTPAPDGETEFDIFPGQLDDWLNKTISIQYEANYSISSIFKDIAAALGVQYKGSLEIDTIEPLPFPIHFNGFCKDFLNKMRELLPSIVTRFENNNLIVYLAGKGTGNQFTLTYLTSAKKDAKIFTIVAPWIPALRPGDQININPIFFKASFGSQVVTGNIFQVLTVNFAFETNGDTNEMTVVCVSQEAA